MALTRRYELVRTIGSGGMAQIYEAIAHSESGFKRKVAIKRILPEFSDDDRMKKSFLDEARVASRLHHANIVQIIDWGIVDGTEFIAMEYVDGIDAAGAERRGRRLGQPMDEGVALHIAAEVAHALAYLHAYTDEEGRAADIVHRDVSPHNILLGWDGSVKLSDFGIALTEIRDQRTATGVVKGKTSYMAPEQARGGKVTPAADVFALGATLHALITGETPIQTADELVKFLAGEALSFSEALSPEAVALIARCMAADPADRPTAAELSTECAQLSVRRLSGDARGALRTYLESIRPALERANVLDRVLGLCIVPAGDEFQYTVTQEAEPGTRSESVANIASQSSPESRAPVGALDPVPEIRAPKRIGWLLPTVGFLFLAVGVGYFIFRDSMTTPDDPPDAGIALAAEFDAAIDDAALSEDAAASLDGSLDGGIVADGGAPRAFPPLEIDLREFQKRRILDAGSPPREDPPAIENGVGWIRVGGTGLVGGRVVIDGVARGHAPLEASLQLGSHRVEVVRDGEVLVSTRVTIVAEHTRRSPAAVLR